MVEGSGRTLIVALSLGAVIVCPAPADAQLAPSTPVVVGQTAAVMPGRLDGLVTDQRGAPLPGAAITAQGGGVQFAVSDERGRFSFYGLKPGPYLVRAVLPGYTTSRRELVQVLPAHAAWQAFRLSRVGVAEGDLPERPVLGASVVGSAETHDHSAVAWRLRHLRRSVLRDEGPSATDVTEESGRTVDAWLAGRELDRLARAGLPSFGLVQDGWLPGLSLTGQVQLLTASNFDTPQELFSSSTIPAGIAYVAIGSSLGSSGYWSAQAAIAQGDLSSWAFAGAYSTEIASRHLLDVAVAYGLQSYEGPNPVALAAVAGGNRNAGAITVSDRWAFASNASLTVGTRHARYGYLEDGPSMWSPSASLRWVPTAGVGLRLSASQSMSAPGAEEFVPSPVGGLWLPSHRTFSTAVAGTPFRPSRTRHLEMSVDREIGAFLLTARGFRQQVGEQITTMFGVYADDRPRGDLGHYVVANTGDVDAYGWGVEVSRPVATRLRGGVAYTLTRARWVPGPDAAQVARSSPSVLRTGVERLHDVTTTLETAIPQVETRIFAIYRLGTGYARSSTAEVEPGLDARFDVQVSQPLPFLDFTSAEWEAIVAVRNLFRETIDGMSVYDELLVVRPPKRIVGGLLVRF